jgi:ATP-dependent DNA ligase
VFEHACRLEGEGIVSKRGDMAYRIGLREKLGCRSTQK